MRDRDSLKDRRRPSGEQLMFEHLEVGDRQNDDQQCGDHVQPSILQSHADDDGTDRHGAGNDPEGTRPTAHETGNSRDQGQARAEAVQRWNQHERTKQRARGKRGEHEPRHPRWRRQPRDSDDRDNGTSIDNQFDAVGGKDHPLDLRDRHARLGSASGPSSEFGGRANERSCHC